MVYKITFTGNFSKDFGLRDQIRRASISVMSNIAEGFEHETQAQFISYLGRAKASAGEIRCQLYIALDQQYINNKQFFDVAQKSEECSKQLFGISENYLIHGASKLKILNRLKVGKFKVEMINPESYVVQI